MKKLLIYFLLVSLFLTACADSKETRSAASIEEDTVKIELSDGRFWSMKLQHH